MLTSNIESYRLHMIINEYGEIMVVITIYIFVCRSRKARGSDRIFHPPPPCIRLWLQYTKGAGTNDPSNPLISTALARKQFVMQLQSTSIRLQPRQWPTPSQV